MYTKNTNLTHKNNELWKALTEMIDICLTIAQEKSPEYYDWLMRWDQALKEESKVKKRRLAIEKNKPPL